MQTIIKSDPKNHFTAWNSMSNIIKKGLAIKENRLPARYLLTESGRRLAYKIQHGITEEDENKNSEDDPSPAKRSSPVKAINENATSNYGNFVDDFDDNDDNGMDDHEMAALNEYNNYNDHLANDYYGQYDEQVTTTTVKYSSRQVDEEILLDSDSDSEKAEVRSSKKVETFEFSSEKKAAGDSIELIDSDSDGPDIIQLDYNKKKPTNNIEQKPTIVKPSTDSSYKKKYSNDSDNDDDMLPDLDMCSSKSKPENSKKQPTEPQKASFTDKYRPQFSASEESLTNFDYGKQKQTTNTCSSVNSLSRYNSDASSQLTGLTQGFDDMLSTKPNNFQSNAVSSAKAFEKKTHSFDSVKTSSSSAMIKTPSVLSKMLPHNYEIILYVDNCEQSHA
jgi:hypothetical protein